jgi:cytochrome c556
MRSRHVVFLSAACTALIAAGVARSAAPATPQPPPATVGGSTISATPDPIAQRRAILMNLGQANMIGGAMARGDMPYDADKAMAVMRVINNGILGMVNYFPEGSNTGPTRALPAVWQNRAEFLRRAENLRAASAAYLQNPPADAAAFPMAYMNVTRNCGMCHEMFRRPLQ